MMRLTSPEEALSCLDSKDREIVRRLALARAYITLTDYTQYRQYSRAGAFFKFHKGKFRNIFKKIRPLSSASCPEIFFLRNAFAHPFNPDYQEPRTLHNLLDGLLRFDLVNQYEDSGVWSHHTKHSSVLITQDKVHVMDCLDRTVTSILKFTQDLKTEGKETILHIAHPQRLASLEILQQRDFIHEPKQAAEPEIKIEEMTWETLFGNKKRSLQEPKKDVVASNFSVQFHDIFEFNFKEVH